MPAWTFNNKINTRHERSLRIIHKGIIYKYINIQSIFQDFLDKGKVGLIQGNTIQTLPTETVKVTYLYLCRTRKYGKQYFLYLNHYLDKKKELILKNTTVPYKISVGQKLNKLYEVELRISGSSLFHPVTTLGTKEFLKKLYERSTIFSHISFDKYIPVLTPTVFHERSL